MELLQLKFFAGRKLDYEVGHHGKRRNEMDFLTAIEFSVEEPYGKAVALLDLRSKHVTVLTFLLLYMLHIFYRETFLFCIT